MMHLRTYILPLALACGFNAWGQETTAQAYFDQASREYVKQDKMTALRTLDQGLQKYPGDPKLLKLAEELIKEEQKKQDQQQQQQKQDQQKNDQQKDQGKQDKQQDQQQQDQQKDEQPQQADQKEQQQQKGDPQAGRIDPRDAMRMLEAMERSEKDVQQKVRLRKRPAVRRTIEKDW